MLVAVGDALSYNNSTMCATSSHNPPATAPRVLFLGMRGEFSRLPLAALLAAGVDVRAVLVPGEDDGAALASRGVEAATGVRRTPLQQLVYQPPPRSTLPLLTRAAEPSIVSLAWERGIPVLELRDERDPAVAPALAAYHPDALCVACWPRRLPPALLALARLGCLNLHPSLLPAHRGPVPLFWALRHGDPHAGVTVHLMDAALDSGDILAQTEIPLEDGLTGAEIERRCASEGGRLLAESVIALARGTAHPTPQPPPPRGEGGPEWTLQRGEGPGQSASPPRAGEGPGERSSGSYEGWPGPDDLTVTPDRPARWAFNFLRGAAHWAGPLVIAVAGKRFVVRTALDYADVGSVPDGWRLASDELWLECAPGVLHVAVE
jgi:methionyl-tRNA formyltransferase